MRNVEIRGRLKNLVAYWMKPLQFSSVNNCWKKLHLKCGGVPGFVFENFAMHGN